MNNNNHKKAWEVFLVIASIVLVILLVYVVYKVVILPAPEQVQKIQPGTNADVLEKLGPRTAVALIFAMIALMALVFWLFITFGRRLSMRGYLGPLARDAIARAEISRLEDSLREDLRYANSLPTPIFKGNWCKLLGYNTYVDLELKTTEYFYPYRFFRNEDFVATYFVDLL